MARIAATLSGVERMLLNRLAEANAALTLNNLHLATKKRILSSADDPSAMLAISQFQSQLKLVTSAMANATSANSMISSARTTISQIRSQLTTIRTVLLTDEDRSLTPSQRAAAQASIDSAVLGISQLAGVQIGGRRLLDGSADFQVSGRNPGEVADVRVYSTSLEGIAAPTQTISGSVITAATQAELTYTGSGGKTVAAATFTLTGELGSASISVTEGQDLDGSGGVAEAINDVSHKTGVTASVSGNVLTLRSVNYGTRASIAVVVTSGSFPVEGGHGDGTANGTNAVAQLNGRFYSSSSTVSGNRFTVNEGGFHYEIEFAGGFVGDFNPITVSGEALAFALSTDIRRGCRLAIAGLQPNRLGGISGTLDQIATGGLYSGLDGNTSRAIRIVDEAIGQIDKIKGAVDGFATAAISTWSNLLQDMETELDDSITATDGFNEAEEKTLQSKNEELIANGLAALAVLSDQRAAMARVIQHIAGLI